ncbi:type IV pilus assembly protein PilM [Geobacter pelophilus]|uniref:Type IV pilus assembly protein PilM n=1 Tax=Geoanaerobacter pelophilus TaxID=60036 RepID=A0AAW4LCM3_9BACT|nr:type IV pilus assembly protein PilM [Geoanaerobacter pelophilus]MBT0665632.1 type IV pilus assembly protein PilM [Geoanaerobacter pelophilus]
MLFQRKKDILGIDIGSSSVKLVQLKQQKNGYSLVNLGLLPLPPEAIVDNALMDSSSIVESVKNLIKSLNIKDKEIACSVSGNSVIIRKILLPAMPPEELEEQIQWEAEQYIPFDVNDVNIDFQLLAQDENDLSKMNVLLVASKKDIINDYTTVFSEAGLKLVVMDVDSFAVQNIFEFNYDTDPDEVYALINVGASIMNINIVRGGISLFTRDVQMGGNLYTEEIQKQFALSRDDAERVKLTGDIQEPERLSDVIDRINDTLAIEIRRSLDFYNSNASDGKISKVFLSGGCSKTSKLAEAVSERLGMPVEILNPFQKIKFSEKEFDPEYLQAIAPLMTVVTGLATRRSGDKW